MSSLSVRSVQLGQSATADQNYTIIAPEVADGTLRIAKGTPSATSQDVISVAANGAVTIPKLDKSYYTAPQVYQQVVANASRKQELLWDAAGNLYWAISNQYNGTSYNINSYVYKITPQGAISIWATAATQGIHGCALAIDAAQNIYWAVGNNYNGTTGNINSYVYKITPAGALTTFATAATQNSSGTALTFDTAGNLYWAVSNYSNGTTTQVNSYIYRITPAGTLTTWITMATTGAIDSALIWDASGNLYWAVGSQYNGTSYNINSYVYRITAVGQLTVWATAITNANTSVALAFDTAGNLYWAVSNHYNGTTYSLTSYVYKITPAGSISTWVSVGTQGGHGCSLLFDTAGNLYWSIGNNYNGSNWLLTSNVYRIDTSGQLSKLASVPSNGCVYNKLISDTVGNLYWAVCEHGSATGYNINNYIYRINRVKVLS